MISVVIPTRNRPDELRTTAWRLIEFSQHPDRCAQLEVLVVDNASSTPAQAVLSGLPRTSSITFQTIRLEHNQAAAARNIGAQHASGPWIVMLDDDSSPLPCDLEAVLDTVPHDVAAVGGEITLPSGSREAGGMPEVVVGCGLAVRRDAFLEVGGYDASFEFYVEEYDLCAKLIGSGRRVVHTTDLRFEHRKTTAGRDFNQIIRRLVRNNMWLLARYAPDELLDREMTRMIERYRSIARRESVEPGFRLGLEQGEAGLGEQPRRPLADHHWRRLSGRKAVEQGLTYTDRSLPDRVRLVRSGKGEDVIRETLRILGIEIDQNAPCTLIGALSPGPVLDAINAHPDALALWKPEPIRGQSSQHAVATRPVRPANQGSEGASHNAVQRSA